MNFPIYEFYFAPYSPTRRRIGTSLRRDSELSRRVKQRASPACQQPLPYDWSSAVEPDPAQPSPQQPLLQFGFKVVVKRRLRSKKSLRPDVPDASPPQHRNPPTRLRVLRQGMVGSSSAPGLSSAPCGPTAAITTIHPFATGHR
jgi:hypothetical protein